MSYRILADALVVVHLGFIAFVIAGGFLTIRWPRVAFAHVPAALWGAAIELAGWICPLTPLEQGLRQAGGEAAYSGGFVGEYIVPIVYPPGLTPGLQLVLGAGVIAVNVVAYALAWWARRRR